MRLASALRLLCLLLLPALACGAPAATPNPLADPSVYNTAVAQTASAASVSAPPTLPPPASDAQTIQQAVANYLGASPNDMQFTLTAANGSAAHGVIVPNGAMEGAAWFAAKDSNGAWIILHIGQGWPLCSVIEPYNFPADYITHCEDENGNTIERAAGGSAALPPNPTVAAPAQADTYAPDPLGPAWTGFWIAHGECYDLDLFSAVNDATCDLRLDANNLFTPQNGALFDASPIQYAPSLNSCKSAALTSAPIDALNATYICFNTNTGKYGFFIPREIQAGGIVFDAYLFP